VTSDGAVIKVDGDELVHPCMSGLPVAEANARLRCKINETAVLGYKRSRSDKYCAVCAGVGYSTLDSFHIHIHIHHIRLRHQLQTATKAPFIATQHN